MFIHVDSGCWRASSLVGPWLVLALWIGGCAPQAAPQPVLTGDAIGVERAAARPAAAGHNSAVYFTIVNPTEQADRLLAAESDVARSTELHETIEENEIVRMQPRPEGFAIPARATTALAPGGRHIMLVEVTESLVEGETLNLTLILQEAGFIQVTVPIMGDIPTSDPHR